TGEVGAEGAIYALRDISECSQHARCEWQTRGDGEIAAPLPGAEDFGEHTTVVQPFSSGANRKLKDEIASKAMTLVEAGEATLGCKILVFLGHHNRASTDGGGVVDRLREHVGSLRGDSLPQTLAEAN